MRDDCCYVCSFTKLYQTDRSPSLFFFVFLHAKLNKYYLRLHTSRLLCQVSNQKICVSFAVVVYYICFSFVIQDDSTMFSLVYIHAAYPLQWSSNMAFPYFDSPRIWIKVFLIWSFAGEIHLLFQTVDGYNAPRTATCICLDTLA